MSTEREGTVKNLVRISAKRAQGESKDPVREDTYFVLHSANIDAICYTTTKASSWQGLLPTRADEEICNNSSNISINLELYNNISSAFSKLLLCRKLVTIYI